MSLYQKLEEDIKTAMKARDSERLTALRGLKSDIKYKMIDAPGGIEAGMDDAGVIAILSTAAKKRKESIEQYKAAGRQELADKESFELAIIQEYLPAQMPEAQLREIIAASIAEAGATSPADAGKVMKVLMPKVKGLADGKLVNQLVSELLAK